MNIYRICKIMITIFILYKHILNIYNAKINALQSMCQTWKKRMLYIQIILVIQTLLARLISLICKVNDYKNTIIKEQFWVIKFIFYIWNKLIKSDYHNNVCRIVLRQKILQKKSQKTLFAAFSFPWIGSIHSFLFPYLFFCDTSPHKLRYKLQTYKETYEYIHFCCRQLAS